jgi:hypothetical protein
MVDFLCMSQSWKCNDYTNKQNNKWLPFLKGKINYGKIIKNIL